jgi:hypothetical protein
MLLTLGSVIRVISISIYLSGLKKFWVGTLGFDCNWGLLTAVADVVGFLALVGHLLSFHLCLLSSWNSSTDGGAVIVV